METYGLGPMELRFAELIWEREPIPSGELVKLCREGMTVLFQRVLEMSLEASWVILVVLVVRLGLKGIPRKYMGIILWVAVLLRLVCPLSLPAEFGLLPEGYAV
jgi:hypothetical protein